MYVMVLLEKLGIMEKSAKIYHYNSRQGTHPITPDPAGTFPFGEHGCRGIVARNDDPDAVDRVRSSAW